jgi:hypothetical protein
MINTDKVREACFNLAEDLMWEKDALRTENIEENIKELSGMTDKLLKIALDSYYQVENLENGQDILIQAINYIEQAHAIPPLRGNYSWFSDTLHTLLELCNPNSIVGEELLPFIDNLEAGINDYRRNIDEEAQMTNKTVERSIEVIENIEHSDSIFYIVAEIRRRPAMYLGKPSIHHLRCYLDGFFHGKSFQIKDAHLFGKFTNWIEAKYEVTSTQGWAKIIEFWSTDEINALENFFILLDEFQANKRT